MRHPVATPRRATAPLGRVRASGGVGGHVGAAVTTRVIEERHDSFGAPRASVELTRFRGHPIVWGKGASTMPSSRQPYPAEYRERLVELFRKGRSAEDLARHFEPSAQAIRNWARQADRDAGRRPEGLTTAEQEELRRLRRENRTLREEREILKKAAAWFARETTSSPPKDSSS